MEREKFLTTIIHIVNLVNVTLVLILEYNIVIFTAMAAGDGDSFHSFPYEILGVILFYFILFAIGPFLSFFFLRKGRYLLSAIAAALSLVFLISVSMIFTL